MGTFRCSKSRPSRGMLTTPESGTHLVILPIFEYRHVAALRQGQSLCRRDAATARRTGKWSNLEPGGSSTPDVCGYSAPRRSGEGGAEVGADAKAGDACQQCQRSSSRRLATTTDGYTGKVRGVERKQEPQMTRERSSVPARKEHRDATLLLRSVQRMVRLITGATPPLLSRRGRKYALRSGGDFSSLGAPRTPLADASIRRAGGRVNVGADGANR